MDVRFSSRSVVMFPLLACGLVALAVSGPAAAQVPADRFEALGTEALRTTESFRPASDAALDAAASNLRNALVPLDALLNRSPSGNDWRKYLDWPTLSAQASSGAAADPAALRRIEKAMNATETGLDMPDFVRVRKAVTRYAEAADAARGADGATRFGKRLDALASALFSTASTGSAEMLAPVPPILERLVESGQAGSLVSTIRGAIVSSATTTSSFKFAFIIVLRRGIGRGPRRPAGRRAG